jgi:hypothetical protein
MSHAQVNQQPDEARELFLAACRPAPALNIINQQLSAAIHSNKGACASARAVRAARQGDVALWHGPCTRQAVMHTRSLALSACG